MFPVAPGSQVGQAIVVEAGPPPMVVMTAVWQTWGLQLRSKLAVVSVSSKLILVPVYPDEWLSILLSADRLSSEDVAVCVSLSAIPSPGFLSKSSSTTSLMVSTSC
jgi:hypothetical protein